MNEEKKYWLIRAMQVYGGSFAKALAEAWQCADVGNARKIEETFADLIKTYENLALKLKKRETGDDEDFEEGL